MKCVCLLLLVVGFGFSQILLTDSLINPGRWVNPESVRVSDDQYGTPSGANDNVIFAIANPPDTMNARLDSVKVYLEQHVDDTTRAFWYVVPVIWGRPGTATPQQAGTLTDATLSFNISASAASWYNVVGLHIDLRPVKGAGATPLWFADYLYVRAFVTTGILEEKSPVMNAAKLTIPSIARNGLTLTYYSNEPSSICIEIFNAYGRKVLHERIDAETGLNAVTLSEVRRFAPGAYFLRMTSANHDGPRHSTTGKFIVLH